MNQESEEDMAEDVEENPELYQALDDSNENAYKSMEVDKTGGIYNGFWWSEWGRLNSLKEDAGPILVTMWVSVILASVSTLFITPNYSLIIVYLFLVVNTLHWWGELKGQEEWVDANSGDGNE